MRGIQLTINAKRFWTMLLVFVCMPFFSFFSGLSGNLFIQDAQKLDISIEVVSNHGSTQHTLMQNAKKPPLLDIFVQDIDPYQIIQLLTNGLQLSSYKNNSGMTIFFGLLYSLLFLAALCPISLSSQSVLCKFNRHFIIPHSAHAPPPYSCLRLF